MEFPPEKIELPVVQGEEAISLTVERRVERFGEVIAYTFRHTPRLFPASLSVTIYRVGPILVDAGSVHDLPLLLPLLEEDPPEFLLLTHHHEDHAGCALALSQHFPGLKVFAPREALAYLEHPPPLPLYRKVIWGESPPLTGLQPLPEEGVLSLNGYTLTVIPTPGHTPWHKGFLFQGERDLLFLGDLVTRWQSPLEWYECSIPAKIRSLEALLEVAPSPHLFLTHLNPVAEGGEVLREELTWLKRESERVQAFAQTHRDAELSHIVEALYGKEPGLYRISQGEFGLCAFVRGVLAPVTHLPAPPLP